MLARNRQGVFLAHCDLCNTCKDCGLVMRATALVALARAGWQMRLNGRQLIERAAWFCPTCKREDR